MRTTLTTAIMLCLAHGLLAAQQAAESAPSNADRRPTNRSVPSARSSPRLMEVKTGRHRPSKIASNIERRPFMRHAFRAVPITLALTLAGTAPAFAESADADKAANSGSHRNSQPRRWATNIMPQSNGDHRPNDPAPALPIEERPQHWPCLSDGAGRSPGLAAAAPESGGSPLHRSGRTSHPLPLRRSPHHRGWWSFPGS